MRVLPVGVASACAAIALASCGSGGDPAALTVSPSASSVAAGAGPVTFTAALASSNAPITWTLAGPGTLSSPTGNTTDYTPPATVGASGATATLTASSGGLSASATITITAGPGGNPDAGNPDAGNPDAGNPDGGNPDGGTGTTMAVSPAQASISAGGGTLVFAASGASGTVSWTLTGQGSIGSIAPATGGTTTYTSPASITTTTIATLTASAGGQTASATITITPAVSGLSVSPAQLTVTAGTGAQTLSAAGGSGTVTWSLSGPGSINPASGPTTSYTPPASVAGPASATVTATAGGVTASATITINPPPLAVSPANVTVAAGSGNQTFTASGGTGSPTWSLSGPGSINPTTGTTTAYTPPATVATTTTATLTASASGQTATATITINPPPPFTLTGKVLAFNRQPVAGASVRVSGVAAPLTTDSTGGFTANNVQAPYDVYVVVGGGSPKVYGWQGLTRHDPTIYLVGFISDFGEQPFLSGTAQSTTINGTVPSATGATVATYRSPELTTRVSVTGATFQTSPTWFGPPATNGTMDVLRWNVPLGSADPSFRRASHAVGLSGMSATTTVTFQSTEFANIAAGSVRAAVTLAAGLVQPRGQVLVKLPSGARAALTSYSGTAPNFSVPNVSGASVELLAGGSTSGNDQAFIRKTGISPTAGGIVNVTVPPAPTLTNGPNISASTTFTWTAFGAPAAVVHVITIAPSDPTQAAFHVATSGNTFKIPAQLVSAGFSLTPGKDYRWYVEGFGPFATIDDAAALTTGPWNAVQDSEMPIDVPLQPDVDPIYGRTAQTPFTAQ